MMNDVAEEIVRIYGYNEIESGTMTVPMLVGGLTEEQKFKKELNNLLCGFGLWEIWTYSFMSAKLYDKIGLAADDPRRKSVEIMNPFGEDTKTMRTVALPSMLSILELNCKNKSAEKVAFYELAKVFIPREGVVTNIHGLEGVLPDERVKISIGLYNAGDFYRMKGIREGILKFAGIENASYKANANEPTFHPGRCADIYASDGTCLGTFGELHPIIAKENYGFDAPVMLAELDFAEIFAHARKTCKYHPIPKFPATTRDFSFVCDEDIEVGTIEDVMRASGVKLIEDIKLFDVYKGAQLPAGKKSVSFSVSLRAPDRTLTVEEADKAAKKILSAIERELGITIRQ